MDNIILIRILQRIVILCFFFVLYLPLHGEDSEDISVLAGTEIRTGKYNDASNRLKKYLISDPDDFNARLLLIEVSEIIGDSRELIKQRRYLKNLYSAGKADTAPALTATAKSVWKTDPKGALILLQKAHQTDKNYLEAYIQAGNLCYDRYAWGKAKKEFSEALKLKQDNPEALSGLAVLDLSAGQIAKATRKIDTALKANPESLSALTLKAYIALIEDDLKKCRNILEDAEKINPNSIDVFCIYAAMNDMTGDIRKRDDYIKRAKKINPSYVDIYNMLSITAEQKYRFKKAVEWAEKAIETDPDHWKGYYLAGSGLLRLGEEKKGYRLLSESFEKNSFNILAYNALNVLDRDFKHNEFQYYKTAHFAVKISREDAPFIWPYLEPILEKTYQKFTVQFKYKPTGPEEHNNKILLHILPDHMSFSARTIGLPGISAEGVCFGQVILMPSPRYASLGSACGMDWKSVFEHEFLHILTLQKSDFRISRWLTEGISTSGESDLHGKWNHFFMMAGKSSKLLPLENLEAGFLNPVYPMQVPVSYYQAALVCRYFKEKHGNDSIIKMIELYRKGKETEEIITDISGMNTDELNKELGRFYRSAWEEGEKFVNTFAGEIKNTMAELKLDRDNKNKLKKKRKWEKLVAYWREKGENDKAAALLNRLMAFDNSDFLLFKILGEIYFSEQKWQLAADTFLIACYRNPFDPEIHKMAAECHKHLTNKKSQEREEKIIEFLNKGLN
jgi:tetratricopeptide (TPR) repeat protein